MFVLVVAAAFAAAGTASGDPSVSAKQAQAQQVLGQIMQLDSSLQRAKSAYDSASEKLGGDRAQPDDQQDRAPHVAREPREGADRARTSARRDLHDA